MKKSQSTVNFQEDAWGDPAQCRRVRKRPAPKGLRQTLGRWPAGFIKPAAARGKPGQSRQAGWPRAGCRGFLLLPTSLWSPAKVLIPP